MGGGGWVVEGHPQNKGLREGSGEKRLIKMGELLILGSDGK